MQDIRETKPTRVISVTQLNRYVKSLLEGDPHLLGVYVSGEISNFTNHVRSGHFYLTLKDEGAVVKAVMFRAFAAKVPFTPENGMKVIVKARVSLYDKDGSYQIYIEEMQPDGIGALQVAYEQLKAKLAEEGLFDERRKRPLPPYPALVGVITSPTGAAVRDILNILGRRYPQAAVLFAPVLVQGEGAPPQLVDALGRFAALKRSGSRYAPDVLIIGPGAAVPSRNCGRSTMSGWPVRLPRRPSPSSRRWDTRPISPSAILPPICGRLPRPRPRSSPFPIRGSSSAVWPSCRLGW